MFSPICLKFEILGANFHTEIEKLFCSMSFEMHIDDKINTTSLM